MFFFWPNRIGQKHTFFYKYLIQEKNIRCRTSQSWNDLQNRWHIFDFWYWNSNFDDKNKSNQFTLAQTTQHIPIVIIIWKIQLIFHLQWLCHANHWEKDEKDNFMEQCTSYKDNDSSRLEICIIFFSLSNQSHQFVQLNIMNSFKMKYQTQHSIKILCLI